jgi:hypothetical protein
MNEHNNSLVVYSRYTSNIIKSNVIVIINHPPFINTLTRLGPTQTGDLIFLFFLTKPITNKKKKTSNINLHQIRKKKKFGQKNYYRVNTIIFISFF